MSVWHHDDRLEIQCKIERLKKKKKKFKGIVQEQNVCIDADIN